MSKTDDIEHALRLLNEAFAKGAISEAEYERQDARLRARQAEIRAWREGQGRGAPTGAPWRLFSGLPGVRCPPRPERRQRPSQARRRGISPSPAARSASTFPIRLLRRRGLAYGGMLPPAIAKTFTVGQAAVLTVVAWEHLHHGACRKSYAEIADEAGCSRRWVKETIGLAQHRGLIAVEHRPRPGREGRHERRPHRRRRLARLDQGPRRAAGEGPSRSGDRGKQGFLLT